MIRVKIRRLNEAVPIPRYMTPGSSGCDVCALLEMAVELSPLDRLAIPTGLSFEIPEGYEIQVRPRSGLSIKHGLTVVNAPGTIDSDYRGELKVLMVNLGKNPVVIQSGDRIAQLVLQRVERIEWLSQDELSETERADSGFGSTGLST